jgi:hypothetical protein
MRFFHGVLVLLLLSLPVWTAGCGQDGGREARPYNDDGFLGLSSTNPNLQTSPSYLTYNKDLKMVNQALDQVRGVTRANVIINGDTIYVRLRIPGGLPRTEIERIEQDAFRAVSYNLPRYRIVVSSNQS